MGRPLEENVSAVWVMLLPAAHASCVCVLWRLPRQLTQTFVRHLFVLQVRRGQRTVQTETKYIELMVVNDYEMVGGKHFHRRRPLSGLFLKCFVLSLSVCADRSVCWEDEEFRQIGGEHGWFGEKMFKCLIIQTITEFQCPVISFCPPHSGWDDCRLLCSPNILYLRIFPSVVLNQTPFSFHE